MDEEPFILYNILEIATYKIGGTQKTKRGQYLSKLCNHSRGVGFRLTGFCQVDRTEAKMVLIASPSHKFIGLSCVTDSRGVFRSWYFV